MSSKPPFVLFLLAVTPLAARLTLAEEPAPSQPAADTWAVPKEFRTIEKAIDLDFAKCKDCGGKGKVKGDRCEHCGGTGEAFHGDHQEFIDRYIAYCDLEMKYVSELVTEDKAKEHVEGNRRQYQKFIERNMGAITVKQKVAKGPGQVGYGKSDTFDGPFNRLACDVMKATNNKPVGHGIAFAGRVARVLTRAAGPPIAEVQLKTATGAERIRYVLVPADVKWAEKSRIRVIGKIADGAAERRAFELAEDAVVVTTYPGTE